MNTALAVAAALELTPLEVTIFSPDVVDPTAVAESTVVKCHVPMALLSALRSTVFSERPKTL